jgi:hypothetical protein
MVSLRAELAQTRAELDRALERIAELEARLRQTPRNSSKPPSSEGLVNPAPRSLRKKSGRRAGGQDGHKGTTLRQVARPDREVRHEPGCCGCCGAGLAGRPVTGVERRQVLDLPAGAGEGDRASVDRARMCLRGAYQGRGPGGSGGAGALRTADRRGRRLPVRRAVLVEADSAGAGRIVRRAAVGRDGRRAHHAGRRAAGRVPGACPRADRRQRCRGVRQDRVPGGRAAALGVLRPVPASTPCSWSIPSAGSRRSRRWACFLRSAGSPCTTPGRPMTATPRRPTSFAVRMRGGNCRPSPTWPPRGKGAGPPRPPTRLPRCGS